MLRTSKGRGILKSIPPNRILIETDGPFSKFSGELVEPIYLQQIYKAFGDFYHINDMESMVFENVLSLIG